MNILFLPALSFHSKDIRPFLSFRVLFQRVQVISHVIDWPILISGRSPGWEKIFFSMSCAVLDLMVLGEPGLESDIFRGFFFAKFWHNFSLLSAARGVDVIFIAVLQETFHPNIILYARACSLSKCPDWAAVRSGWKAGLANSSTGLTIDWQIARASWLGTPEFFR